MSLKNIRIVLARPSFGGNLGSICRAMKNMGITDLAVVQPEPGMDFAEAQMMALHAQDVLDGRRQFDSVAEAVADCALVAGTTARTGLYRNHAKSPREWTPRLLEAARKNKVALVFGCEAHGLSNEELALCTQILRIPSSNRYSSINLSQAVMICCYELFVGSEVFEPPQEAHPEAPVKARERMIAVWQEMLQDVGFFNRDNLEHMMMGFRRIFSRGPLSQADVNILMGVARQVQWALHKAEKPHGVVEGSAPSGPGSESGAETGRHGGRPSKGGGK